MLPFESNGNLKIKAGGNIDIQAGGQVTVKGALIIELGDLWANPQQNKATRS